LIRCLSFRLPSPWFCWWCVCMGERTVVFSWWSCECLLLWSWARLCLSTPGRVLLEWMCCWACMLASNQLSRLSCLWAACCGCLYLPDPLGFSPLT
jgi:hypothetical protein